MIKINLVREGRAPVRGAAGGPAAAAGGRGALNPNNIVIGLCFVIGLVAAGGWYFVKKSELDSKLADVQAREADAQRLEKIIKEVEEFERRKENLEKRIETINNLKKNQKGPVRIMDRISQDLPDLVWLDTVSLATNEIQVGGRGLNPNAIAIFIENIKADPIFEEPEVSELTRASAGTGPAVYTFRMKVKVKLQEPRPAEGEGEPGAKASG